MDFNFRAGQRTKKRRKENLSFSSLFPDPPPDRENPENRSLATSVYTTLRRINVSSTFHPPFFLPSFLPSFPLSHLPFRTTLCSRRRIRRSNRDPPFLSHSLSPLPPVDHRHAFAFAAAAEERDVYRGSCREHSRKRTVPRPGGEIHDAVIREAAGGLYKGGECFN